MAGNDDTQSRISSVQNIKQITRAMEMVAASRLRKAEERIKQLREYADAIRRMTKQAVEGAGDMPDIPILEEHDSIDRTGILLMTGDRGLAGPFNSQILRAGTQRARTLRREENQEIR